MDALTNGERLPIVLAMTCLRSAFQQPAYSGTTLDERLVLHPNGGAIATWGPPASASRTATMRSSVDFIGSYEVGQPGPPHSAS